MQLMAVDSPISPFNLLFPLRIPPPPTVPKDYNNYRFFITESNGYLYRPPSCSKKNPIIVVFESHLPRGSFYPCLLYPLYFSKRERVKNSPKVLDVQQCWRRSLFTTYYVRVAWPATSEIINADNVLKEEWIMPMGGSFSGIDKVVLISYDIITNKSTICNPGYTRIRSEVDLYVVTRYGELYFLSTRSMNWESSKCEKMDDVINYRGMLWAIDKIGRAFVLDNVKSLVLTRVVDVQQGFHHPILGKRRLVEASGELYMVGQTEMRLEVYKMKGREWVSVKGVGDHIFYVMKGLCFSAVAERELCLSNNDGSIKKGNIMFVDYDSFRVSKILQMTTRESSNLSLLSGVAFERAFRGFGVYDFGNGKRLESSADELPGIFCSI